MPAHPLIDDEQLAAIVQHGQRVPTGADRARHVAGTSMTLDFSGRVDIVNG
jgi:hypothetical protein